MRSLPHQLRPVPFLEVFSSVKVSTRLAFLTDSSGMVVAPKDLHQFFLWRRSLGQTDQARFLMRSTLKTNEFGLQISD